MIDATRPSGVHADDVLDALRSSGFGIEIAGEHAIATRDASRFVLPAPGRHLPATVAQRLEHALRPLLGRGWLRPEVVPTSACAGPTNEVVLLDAVVDLCDVTGTWCSFLPSELSVMGFGPSRESALRDLKRAAALWIGIEVEQVALITPDVF